jgi:hypothetical protein
MAKDGPSGWGIAVTALLGAAGIGYVAKSIHEANEKKRLDEFVERELSEYHKTLALEAERKKVEERRRCEVNRVYAPCRRHGLNSEQCLADSGWHDSENRCIECNGGIGDSSDRWCQSCQDYYDTINSDDD